MMVHPFFEVDVHDVHVGQEPVVLASCVKTFSPSVEVTQNLCTRPQITVT